MNEFLFYIIILLSNIIQGITGFAGTILAMPFSLRLVGIETAVPVLNLLGLLSGIYVFAGNYKKVDRIELKHVVIIMGASLIAGLYIKSLLSKSPRLLYIILGCIVIIIALQGLLSIKRQSKPYINNYLLAIILIAAGIVHGMYVCGGPLLISYMTRKLPEKSSFRATISTVWIFLNGMLFLSHILGGAFTPGVIKSSAISLPFFLGGMFIGAKLYSKMSQRFFVLLTYILLLIAGISLFFK